MANAEKLRIVHCVRSPFGGIFRHILDLAHQQHLEGHDVGLILDSETCSPFEEAKIQTEAAALTLGVHKFPIKRTIWPGDLIAFARMYKALSAMKPDVVHTHGAKGGALGRSVASCLASKPVRLYCPHGGSLHYDKKSLKGRIFFALERLLEQLTDSLVFVSEYEMRSYSSKVGQPNTAWCLAYNGLRPAEFTPIEASDDAADFLMIGQLRDLKGPDLFIDAIKMLHDDGKHPTALIVGAGEDEQKYHQMVANYGLGDYISFSAPMPAAEAFAKSRCVVVPSRAESLPYIVLETIGAHKPLIATRVGGIPEIFAEHANQLVPADNAKALSLAMGEKLASPDLALAQARQLVQSVEQTFSLDMMNRTIMDQYLHCLRNRSNLSSLLTTKSKSMTDAA
ncbi:MAG: glycosyltransferase [Cohaesibacter sp.]|jgi:glycosyltransferase involved in cell wall biosynthesis|nr:glycosyltransferase [Cohaesibacter sp.]